MTVAGAYGPGWIIRPLRPNVPITPLPCALAKLRIAALIRGKKPQSEKYGYSPVRNNSFFPLQPAQKLRPRWARASETTPSPGKQGARSA